MSQFELYLQLGFQHITDINGYDHILFLIALCASYIPSQWKQILILVTAFTIGHSITLALSTLNIVLVPSEIIEFLIPVTILLTAVSNLNRKSVEIAPSRMRLNYLLAIFFGLIHGMGFSNYLKTLLGQEESIIAPLFAFNIGLELGQIIIVAIIMAIAYIFLKLLKTPHRIWNFAISLIVIAVALKLMYETKFW